MKRLLFLACFILISTLGKAQTKYNEQYKAAYNLIGKNQDSAVICKSFYLLAYTARKSCSYKLALYGYQNAQKYATDSTSYIKANIAIASAYFSVGDYKKAHELNTQNITYLKQKKKFAKLSIAYDLWGRILLEEKKETALPVLREALRLRQVYKKKSIGSGYESLAQAFFRFRQYDSAAFYQRQIVQHYPSPSPSNQAYNRATLAKYLVFGGKLKPARQWLAQAEGIKNTLAESQLYVAHARSLWLQASQHAAPALASFRRCDSLITAARQSKQSVIEKRAVNKKAIRIYKDILQAKLPATIREKYEAKLDAAQAWYSNYTKELELKDEQRTNKIFSQQVNKQNTFLPIYIGFGAIVVAGLSLFYYYLLPGQRYLRQEKKLLKTLEIRMARELTKSEQQIAIMILKGSSLKELGESFLLSKDAMRYQAKKLANAAKIDSLYPFAIPFRVRYQKKLFNLPWGKSPKE